MKHIWIDTKKEDKAVVYFENRKPLKGVYSIRISAGSFYSLFLNHRFFCYGPSRAPEGYSRVREIAFAEPKDISSLEIVVNHYGAPSFDTDFFSPFFGIEIFDKKGKILADSFAFKAYTSSLDKLPTSKYSFQRGFIERFNLVHIRKEEKEIHEIPSPILLKEKEDRCRYPLVPFQKGREGKGNPFSDTSKIKNLGYLKDPNLNHYDIEKEFLSKLDQDTLYTEYSLPYNRCGLLKVEIEAEKEGELFLFFDEVRPNGKWIYARSSANDFVNARYPKGHSSFLTRVPYQMMHLLWIHQKGVTITPSLIAIENNTFPGRKYSDDPDVQRVVVAAEHSFRQNAADLFTDCPGRERAGWLCDSYFTALGEYYYTGKGDIEHDFLENFLLGKTKELPKGMLPMSYPSEHRKNDFIPNWAMWFVLELKRYVYLFQDEEMKKKAKKKVYELKNYFKKFENEYGLLENLESWVFLEWSACNEPDHVQGVNFPTNMLYSAFLSSIADLYEDKEARKGSQRVKKAILDLSFKNGFFIDNAIRDKKGNLVPCLNHLSETAQYYAIFTKVKEDKTYIQRIIHDFGPLGKETGTIAKSAPFIGYVLRLLILIDQKEFSRAKTEAISYYLAMAEKTGTIWEKDDPTASCNHGFSSCLGYILSQAEGETRLESHSLSDLYDEGYPLGNATIGALVYSQNPVRISLDRMDLWDDAPLPEAKEKGFNYPNLVHLVKSGKDKDYQEHLRLFDACYGHKTPTKIKAGRLLLDVKEENPFCSLDVKTGVFSYRGKENSFDFFFLRNPSIGVIYGNHLPKITFEAPKILFDKKDGLGYPPVKKTKKEKVEIYTVLDKEKKPSYSVLLYKTKNAFYFTILNEKQKEKQNKAIHDLLKISSLPIEVLRLQEESFFLRYDQESSLHLANKAMEKEYLLSDYFLACVSKAEGPAMPLQGLWCADKDKLPPWKGDYHFDLNVQMCYLSSIKGNHPIAYQSIINYLWSRKDQYEKNAKDFYHVKGLIIPGVSDNLGRPLGGWPMYALSPTMTIFMIKVFDNVYQATKDINFLKEKAYPMFLETAEAIEGLFKTDKKTGKLTLPLSSSPEYHEGDKEAYLPSPSNHDIAWLRYLFSTLASYQETLGLSSRKAISILSKLPSYTIHKNVLWVDEEEKISHSHRHFSHLFAAYPLFDVHDKVAIASIQDMNSFGTQMWVGFSFPWMALLENAYGKTKEAKENLSIFLKAFISKNGFHLNGDYKKLGYSSFDYRPFTLEGNFGYQRAIQDGLVFLKKDTYILFSMFQEEGTCFEGLRLEGNLLFSGSIEKDSLTVEMESQEDTNIKLKIPFLNYQKKLHLQKGRTRLVLPL